MRTRSTLCSSGWGVSFAARWYQVAQLLVPGSYLPRDVEDDYELIEQLGCDAIYCPCHMLLHVQAKDSSPKCLKQNTGSRARYRSLPQWPCLTVSLSRSSQSK